MQERFETFTVLINRISRDIRRIKNQEMAAYHLIETNGFIVRDSERAKRYRSPLRLTEKGREVGKRIAEKIGAVLDTISHTLTEDERAAFYRSLSAISGSLEVIAQNSEERKEM